MLIAVALGLIGLAGCGGSDSGSSGGSPAAAKSEIKGLSAEEVLTKVQTAAKAAKSAKVVGDIVQGTDTTKLDILLTAGGGGSGTVEQNGSKFELVVIDKDVYVKPDAKTLKTLSGGNTAVEQLIGDKYIKTTTDNPSFSSISGTLSLPSFIDSVLTPEGKLELGPGKDVDGTPTVALTDGDKEGGGNLYVADAGPPYPLLLEPPAASSDKGQIAFSDWDKEVALTPPPADQVIDFDELSKAR
jgi:hypothetical protein